MTSISASGISRVLFGQPLLISIFVWTLLVGLSLVWNRIQLENQAEYLATEEARANWNKDQAFRRWATRHGGLYVKPDERTPPNPYLAHLPKRDVVTTDGTKLTLMNPAYMMRQMTEEFEEMYGVKGSITGQILLNPINKADPWELQALKRFDLGEQEIVDVSHMEGKPYLRLMRPMLMKQGCVKCHGHLGFKAGDIRGGVSVSIPLTPYLLAAAKTSRAVNITHAGIWLLGLMVILFVIQRSKRFEQQRAQHEQDIKDIAQGVSSASDELFFAHLVEHVARMLKADYVFIGLLNKNKPDIVNTKALCAYGKTVENIEYTLKNSPCAEVIGKKACVYSEKVQQLFPKDKLLGDMNVEAYIGRTLVNSQGESLGLLVVLNREPLKHTDKTMELLEIFATRAAGEIERLNSEQALRRSQKMDAIGQLSGGIAHDFNNQLGIIIGYLDFLKEHVEGEEKPSKWVKTANNAALRCTDLTRQLLSFARTQSEDKTVVNLNALLTELQTMFTRSIMPSIEVEYSLTDKPWLTEIDAGEFQDVVLNLIINARDAMPNGGKLVIATSNECLDNDFVAMNEGAQAGDYVQFVLSDTGCGMSKAVQERIFEPFYTTKAKGKGTGLGMAMVYGFAKRFGGFILVYSEVDVGTTFRLYLPRSMADTVDETVTMTDESPPSGNETILIVDDEIALLHLAEEFLSDLGYKTYVAEGASQAVEMLEQKTDIDCLFSDVIMPGGINGYELAQKAIKLNPKLKILLTSGFAAKAIDSNEEFSFSTQLLSKPYRKIELAKRIRQVLDEE
ncbi:c-type heme family protein [sulfur-oxidizing endosymbiont of Gigantopelta aegis]|uniref:c-type heme family protein n=1 Tax=sulfur-oxidizing endosymbiont of Gigantopelta aegis TaxID=2794934 RepID=UPI0018DE1EFE|nr:DUF3365 domain-containing protein [sulfur-oxidizing endosymbiont of Gigantopelta aegis]